MSRVQGHRCHSPVFSGTQCSLISDRKIPYCAEVLSFHFLPFINAREIIQRAALKLTNPLDWPLSFHRPVGGWLLEDLFLTTPSFHPKCRFPVSIKGAWLQGAGVGVELLKRKLCVRWSHVEWSQAQVLMPLPALSNECSVANNCTCFTKGIACRCGYDNL